MGEPHSWATLPTPASAAVGGATSRLSCPGAEAPKPSGSRAMTTLSPVTGVGQTREGQGRKPGDDRGGPSLAVGNAAHPRGLRPALLSPTQPTHNPPLHPWPYPTPNMASACSPMRSMFMLAAVGSKTGRRGRCVPGAGKMENIGVRERETPKPPPAIPGWAAAPLPVLPHPPGRGETIQGTGCAALCPAGMSRVLGRGSWSGSGPDWP